MKVTLEVFSYDRAAWQSLIT